MKKMFSRFIDKDCSVVDLNQIACVKKVGISIVITLINNSEKHVLYFNSYSETSSEFNRLTKELITLNTINN